MKMERLNVIKNDLIAKFGELSWQRQIWSVALLVVIMLTLTGALPQFISGNELLDREAISRSSLIIKLAPYDLDAAAAESGVKEAFIADKNGLVISPASRVKEDARKFPVVRKVLSGEEFSMQKMFGRYELAQAVWSGKERAGAAFIVFSTMANGFPELFWYLVRSFIISGLIIGGAAHLMIATVQKRSLSAAKISPPPKEAIEEDAIFSMSELIDRPIFFMDETFVIRSANNAARSKYEGAIGKHIIDIGREYMAMAEEMEMLQLHQLKGEGATLWRIGKKNGEMKYGLIC